MGLIKKILLFVPSLIAFIIIGAFILPFSLGKIHQGLLCCLNWLAFLLSFIVSVLFLLLYLLTFAKVSWFITMASSLDQVGNTAINGNQDNTVSGRLGYKIKMGKANCCEKLFCRILSMYDPTSNTHCISSIEDDERNVI